MHSFESVFVFTTFTPEPLNNSEKSLKRSCLQFATGSMGKFGPVRLKLHLLVKNTNTVA